MKNIQDYTIQECMDYITNYLKSEKIKYEIHSLEHCTFKIKNYTYSIYIEGPEDVQYRISDIDGLDLNNDYFECQHMNHENFQYIEDYIFTIKSGEFNYIEKICKVFSKLEDEYGSDIVEDLAKEYFKLF